MDRSPPRQEPQRRSAWRGRIGATAASAAAHAALVAVLLIGWRTPAPPFFEPAVAVSFAPPLPLQRPKSPAPKPAAAHKATAAPKLAAAHAQRPDSNDPPPKAARPSPAPPTPESPPVETRETSDGSGLTDAQIAGAQTAGEGQGVGAGDGGGGGGDCNMARRVQAAVRKDPLATAAIRGAGGRALMIWNGDWIQHGGEDGKGLAAVREAITWEVAFAPPACRHQRVRGLILLSLADGSTRLALGAGEWRWSDLLGLR